MRSLLSSRSALWQASADDWLCQILATGLADPSRQSGNLEVCPHGAGQNHLIFQLGNSVRNLRCSVSYVGTVSAE